MLMMMTSEPNQISIIVNEKDMDDRKENQLLSKNEWYSDSLSLKSILILLFSQSNLFYIQRADIYRCNI